jgi:hypothetical protein
MVGMEGRNPGKGASLERLGQILIAIEPDGNSDFRFRFSFNL